jgi:hypothetical protein
MSRRCKTVDAKRVIELASKGHTLEEIAVLEGVSHWTLHRRFATHCEKGKLLCAGRIRAKQVEKALAGNGDTTMLIWLGKQLLGQRDKHEVETNWPETLGYGGGLPVPQRETELGRADKPN